MPAAVVVVGQVPARERVAVAHLVCAGVGEGAGERPATVPVPVVQIAPYRGVGLIFRWGQPWDYHCQRPREEG